MQNTSEHMQVIERVNAADARVRGHHLRTLASIYDYIEVDGLPLNQAVDVYVKRMKDYYSYDVDYLHDVLGKTPEQEQSFKRLVGNLYQNVMQNTNPDAEIALLVGMKDDICVACQGEGSHCGNLTRRLAIGANFDDGNCIKRAVSWIERTKHIALDSYYITNKFILQAGVRKTRVVFAPAHMVGAYIRNNSDKILE